MRCINLPPRHLTTTNEVDDQNDHEDQDDRANTDVHDGPSFEIPTARRRAFDDEGDVLVARAFADLATISILQLRVAVDSQLVNEQLSHALTSRIVIEQAKGIVFERAGVNMADAFAWLRNYARSHNRRLTDVAQSAIDGTLDPEIWAVAPPSSSE